jgi:type I restriction enzyme S subunit
MNTKALRQKILDLAIHGKLVPQDPNDEPASVLLERIRDEKERLIKEGKIKRPKKTKETSDKPHYPYELPEGWCWTTLGEICCIKGGKRIPRGMTFAKGKTAHVYIRVTDMKDNTIKLSDLKYIDDYVYEHIKNYTINASDLYLTIAGTIGSVGIVPNEVDGMNLTENAAKLTQIGCIKEYLLYALLSTIAQEHFISRFHQVAQPKLSIETASKTPIAMPPIGEQNRIVKEIKRYLAAIKIIEEGQTDLETTISQAKSKILDLAIHGKLVPQDPTDEPAAKLLKRINPKAEITSDNGHYQKLPEGWAVCQLDSIVSYEQPTPYIVKSTDYDDSYSTPVLTAGKSFIIGHTNETNGIYEKLPCIIFDDFTTDSKLVDFPFKVKSSAMKILQVKEDINIEYIAMFMSITRLIGDTHKRYWISEYSKIEIPIPPQNEQDRIVKKVRFLLSRLEEMIENL